MKELIDKQELIYWTNKQEVEINISEYSEYTKEIHRDYMNLFRRRVRAAKPERDISTLVDGIFIGIPIGIIIDLIIYLVV